MLAFTESPAMIAKRTPPGLLASRFIEWQAGRIPDPISRLRYLRKKGAAGRGNPQRWLSLGALATAVLLALVILGPRVQTGSDAKGRPLVANGVPGKLAPPPVLKPPPKIWRVELRKDQEVYSNGLRIENRFLTSNYQRAYRVYPLNRQDGAVLNICTEPAGIVFHTTESSQAPFAADHNSDLRRITQNTIEHARLERSYHFVIDRFGRVFRVVQETDVAFHAGKSLWADDNGVYIGLNDSFLGVSFEGRTLDISEGAYLGPAQILSGKLLVQMLLDRYHIPIANCITHSQVSVNPDIMKIGNHTDGAGDFPFEQLGLADNYAQPPPSIYMFGFDYDMLYLKSTGSRLWRGLFLAEQRVRQEAMARRLSVSMYKKALRGNYQRIAAALEIQGAPEEKE
jgi:hypothetical protein